AVAAWFALGPLAAAGADEQPAAEKRTAAPAGPKLSLPAAEALGAAAGLALGVTVAKSGSSAGGPQDLTSLGKTDAILAGAAIAMLVAPRLLARRPPEESAILEIGADPLNGFDERVRRFALRHTDSEKRVLFDNLSWGTLSLSLLQ